MSYNIYIAGSFSNEQEKKDIYSLIDKVRKIHPNSELFIPMEHFVEGGNEKMRLLIQSAEVQRVIAEVII